MYKTANGIILKGSETIARCLAAEGYPITDPGQGGRWYNISLAADGRLIATPEQPAPVCGRPPPPRRPSGKGNPLPRVRSD